jgi:hypothetical protein
MDQMCFECDADDASLSSEVRTLLLCMAIIMAILLVFAAHRLYRAHAERGETKDAGEMRWVRPSFTAGGAAPLKIYAKICISHYQILTQFRASLGPAVAYLLFAIAEFWFWCCPQRCSSTSPSPPSSRAGSTSCPCSPWISTHSSVSEGYSVNNSADATTSGA